MYCTSVIIAVTALELKHSSLIMHFSDGRPSHLILILIIVAFSSCLAQSRARNFRRIGKVSNRLVNTTYSTKETIHDLDSCRSPKQLQLKYYNKLYKANARRFTGNTVYYALKATKSQLFSAVNNDIVANITDYTRFTPAGMDLANKVVCAKILQEMDAETRLFSNTALCAWDYICDYKENRFPNYLFRARCKTAKCNGNCSEVNNHYNRCQSHGIHVTVLQMSGICGEWVWGQELLPIACTCTNDVMMKVESILR